MQEQQLNFHRNPMRRKDPGPMHAWLSKWGFLYIDIVLSQDLAGRPLLAWCVKAALDSGCFDEVYVSTDHDGIAEVAGKAGARVHRRAPETATSSASTELAMADFARAHPDYDVLCLIQATSPLTTPYHFREAIALFKRHQADSLVTAVRSNRFRWRIDPDGAAHAENYLPAKRPRRQDWDGELIENGAFYLTKKDVLEKDNCRLGGKIAFLTRFAFQT
ncbi:unnamed protein product [Durusdinium trenchii]|uniref:N-acylneuraminate cytidylyltransferase n=1 Tax=Durusdinium trenchii TaxID=1381693 RepID=A0ABP0LMF3_9DINO